MAIAAAGDAITTPTTAEKMSMLPCDPSASHRTATTIQPRHAAQLTPKKIIRQDTMTDQHSLAGADDHRSHHEDRDARPVRCSVWLCPRRYAAAPSRSAKATLDTALNVLKSRSFPEMT